MWTYDLWRNGLDFQIKLLQMSQWLKGSCSIFSSAGQLAMWRIGNGLNVKIGEDTQLHKINGETIKTLAMACSLKLMLCPKLITIQKQHWKFARSTGLEGGSKDNRDGYVNILQLSTMWRIGNGEKVRIGEDPQVRFKRLQEINEETIETLHNNGTQSS